MHSIDLRSDTVTKPTAEMRQAMVNAEVGDDVYGDDPTVLRLEKLAASILGKEAALFVPSGTFGNQTAILTHCSSGDEVILDDSCHIVQHECGAAAKIAGVQLRTTEGDLGQIPLKALVAKIRKAEDIHYPKTGLICLENAHGGGFVLPLDYMKAVYEIARKYGIPLHLDGARIFNASEYLKVEPEEIAAYTDSVMFCLSKGLCAPIGSILAGTKEFIHKAKRNRKLMGGAMRQTGIVAAAGIVALEKMRSRLSQDHKNARLLGKWLGQIEGITVSPKQIQTNMVFCKMDYKPPLTPEMILARMASAGIITNPPEEDVWRFVTHIDIREKDILHTVNVIKGILTKDYW